MDPEVILIRFQSGLTTGRFTLAAAARATGLPMTTLQGLRDQRGRKLLSRIRVIEKALPSLDPAHRTVLVESFATQAPFDPSRPVREQAPDVERDLERFGVPLHALLQKIGVSLQVWKAWKAGDREPSYSRWVGVLKAAQTLIDLAAVDASHERQSEATGAA